MEKDLKIDNEKDYEVVKNDKRSKVIYNPKNKKYKKCFYPKFSKRIKWFFKMGRYPGHNFKYISDVLNTVGIKTVNITDFNKYEVTTQALPGKPLAEVLKESNTKKAKMCLGKYINLIKKLIDNRIYFADYTCNNFFMFDGEIYALDLEDYRKDCLFNFRKKKMLKKMESKIQTIPKECLEKINVTHNDILKEILEN